MILVAKSAAKRKREHQLRNLGKDVTIARNEVNFSTHVRMTKSKKENYSSNIQNTRSISQKV